MSLEEEIFEAKGKNWARLVAQRADKICKLRENEPDLMIQILNGDIFNEAVDQIALEIKCGLYDQMLTPKEYTI